jgi:hypothetical protein
MSFNVLSVLRRLFVVFVPVIALSGPLTGCRELKQTLNRSIGERETTPIQDGNTNLRNIIHEEVGLTTIDSAFDVIEISRWTRSKLELNQVNGQVFLSRLLPQQAPRYFREYVAEADSLQVTSFCQKNALSLAEILALYGVFSRDVHYIDVPTGAGLHQFTEYELHGRRGIIDQYYGAVYVENGQPVSLARMQAQRAALNDADMTAWINSVTTFYMAVSQQGLHDVRLDWLVGTFVY